MSYFPLFKRLIVFSIFLLCIVFFSNGFSASKKNENQKDGNDFVYEDQMVNNKANESDDPAITSFRINNNMEGIKKNIEDVKKDDYKAPHASNMMGFVEYNQDSSEEGFLPHLALTENNDLPQGSNSERVKTPVGAEDENSLNFNKVFNTGRVASELADISTEIMAQSKLDHGCHLLGVFSRRAIDESVAYGNAKINSWFNSFGNMDLNTSFDPDLTLRSFYFDYLFPLYESKHRLFFTQFGYHQWDARHLVNVGLGYRELAGDFFWGVNAFLDKDFSLSHRRVSLGMEIGEKHMLGYVNYYFPISDWRSVEAPEDYMLESRPAEGLDFGLKLTLPTLPYFIFTTEYFRWHGQNVDFLGGFSGHVNTHDFLDLIAEPHGVNLILEYRPIPLLGASITDTFVSQGSNDLRLSINMNINFDMDLSRQFSFKKSRENLLQGITRSFVNRNYNMVLSYAESSPFSSSGGSVSVFLDRDESVQENQKTTLDPQITSAFPVSSYTWTGTGVAYLDNPNSKNPTFSAPFWVGTGDNDNVYGLLLTIIDNDGNTYSADCTMSVWKDASLDPSFTFMLENKVVSGFSVSYGGSAPKILWDMESIRNEELVGREGDSVSASQDKTITHFQWTGDTSVLVDKGDRYPQINSYATVKSYTLKLVVETENEGEVSSQDVSVIITPNSSGGGSGLRLEAGDDVVRDYAAGATFSQPATNINPGATVDYASKNTLVATVDKDGLVTIHNAGTTEIIALESATEVFEGQKASYLLTVNAVNTDLKWDIEDEIEDGRIIKEVSDRQYVSSASATLGDVDSIRYNIENITNSGVAEINNFGLVLLNKAGVVWIIATQPESSDGNYKETSIRYSLTVGKSTPDFVWIIPPPVTETYSPGLKFTVQADSSSLNGDVVYESSDYQVADIDHRTGEVIVHRAGTAEIIAYLSPNDQYVSEKLTEAITINKADNDTLHFHGIVSGSQVERNYGDEPFTYLALPTNYESDGTITYQSSNSSVASVDRESGLVTIHQAGSTSIEATQAEGTNYLQGTLSYDLTVHPIKSDLVWDDPLARGGGVVTKVLGESRFSIKAESNHTGSGIVYESTDTGVASVNSSGLVTVNKTGTTAIVATQPASGNYSLTSIRYVLLVNTGAHSDLRWDTDEFSDHDLIGNRLLKHFGDPAYIITAVSDNNTTGTITYSISGDADVAKINRLTGRVTLGSKTGTVIILATQLPSSEYEQTVISYVLQVARNQTPLLTWDTLADGETVNTTFDKPDKIQHQASSITGSSGDIFYTSSAPEVAAVNASDGAVVVTGAGMTDITAHLRETNNFVGQVIRYHLEVAKARLIPNLTLKWSADLGANNSITIPVRSKQTMKISALSNSDGVINYTSTASGVASVEAATGMVTIHGVGNTVITAVQDEGTNYLGNRITYTLVISPIKSDLEWDDPVARGGGVIKKELRDQDFTIGAQSNSSAEILYKSTNTNIAAVDEMGTVTIRTMGTTDILASQAASGDYARTTISYTLTVGASGIHSDLYWDSNEIVNGKLLKYFGNDPYTIEAKSSNNTSGEVTYAITGNDSANIATIDSLTGLVTLGNRTGVVQVSATQAPDDQSQFDETTISYVLEVARSQDPGLMWDVIADGETVQTTFGSASTVQHQANSSEGSTGEIVYTSSVPEVAAVNPATGAVVVVGAGVSEISAHLKETDNFIGQVINYTLQVNKSQIIPDVTLKWSQNVKHNGNVTIPFSSKNSVMTEAFTALSISPTAVITYRSSDNNVVAVDRSTGRLDIKSITTSPVTITATQAETDNYERGSIIYNLSVAPASSALRWNNQDLRNCTDADSSHLMYQGDTLDASAISALSQGTIYYTSTDPAVAVIDKDGTVNAKATGTTMITAIQEAWGNFKRTSLRLELEVAFANPVSLIWDTAEANSGLLQTNFDAGSFVSIVTPVNPGIQGSATYSLEPAVSDVAEISLLSGNVTFKKAGTVKVVATYRPRDTQHTVTTASYDIEIEKGTGLPLIAGGDRMIAVGRSFTQPAKGGNTGNVVYTSDDVGIATVDAATGEVTGVAPGRAVIRATEPATEQYKLNTDTYNILVMQTMAITGLKDTPVEEVIQRYAASIGVVNAIGDVTWSYSGNNNISFRKVSSGNSLTLVLPQKYYNTSATSRFSSHFQTAATNNYEITIRATDSTGAYVEKSATITIEPLSASAYRPVIIDNIAGTFMMYEGEELPWSQAEIKCTALTDFGANWTGLPAVNDYRLLYEQCGSACALKELGGIHYHWSNQPYDVDNSYSCDITHTITTCMPEAADKTSGVTCLGYVTDVGYAG